MEDSRLTCCVVTRAQHSESPYIAAFLAHYLVSLEFDKVFIVYCDRANSDAFKAAIPRSLASRVEVLLDPRNTENIDRSFNLHLARFKDYAYCLNVDFDEYLSIPDRTVSDWLERHDHPRSIVVPWLNLVYVGAPIDTLKAAIDQGELIPNNTSKTMSRTERLRALTAHGAEFEGRTAYDYDLSYSWFSDRVRLPGTAEPISVQTSRRTFLSVHSLEQQISGPARSASCRTSRHHDFSFILHFNVRGPVDLLLKTAHQRFNQGASGPNRGGGLQAISSLLEAAQESDLPFDKVPPRFRYAIAFRRMMQLDVDQRNLLRDLLENRLGDLQIDVDAQRSSFMSMLREAGFSPGDCADLWDKNTVSRVYEDLDRRFGVIFQPDSFQEEREQVLEALARTFDMRVQREGVLRSVAVDALDRAFAATLKKGVSGQARIDALTSQVGQALSRSFALVKNDPDFEGEWQSAIDCLRSQVTTPAGVKPKRFQRWTVILLLRAFSRATSQGMRGEARIASALSFATAGVSEKFPQDRGGEGRREA